MRSSISRRSGAPSRAVSRALMRIENATTGVASSLVMTPVRPETSSSVPVLARTRLPDSRNRECMVPGSPATGSTSSGTAIKMSASQATRITNQLVKGLRHVVSAGHQPVLLASPQVRAVARQLVESQMPGAAVLGYNEIVNGIEVESLALITQGLDNQGQEDDAAQQAFAPAAA